MKTIKYITIDDVMGSKGPVEIDGIRLDATVNMTLRQVGDDDIEVDSEHIGQLNVVSDNNYLPVEIPEVSTLYKDFVKEATNRAIDKAKNMPEYKWETKLDLETA